MPGEVGSGGQRWPLFTVCQSFVLTQVSAARRKSLMPVAPKSEWAQELCKLVQRDLLKGMR